MPAAGRSLSASAQTRGLAGSVRRLAGVFALVLGAGLHAQAQDALVAENIVYPADAGVLNVKTAYGAIGDGFADDTQAIQNAINAARGYLKGKTVYLPNGTYLIKNRLVFTTDQFLHRTLIFQGQSREGTILKLDNGLAPATANLPVIKCFEPASGTQTFTNSMFTTNICNLTINTGSNNPGAVGISYLASNQSIIRNVLIKSGDGARTGRAGIEITAPIPGPAMLKNVTVEGFNIGISARRLQYSLTFENITLRNQLQFGIRNDAQTLCIRHLLSDNTVPALTQVAGGESKGMITLIDSQLNGGAAANYGIDLADGYLFARNVTTTGYASALRVAGTAVAGANITEYVSGGTTYSTQTPVQPASLNLPILETPELPIDASTTWRSVGTTSNGIAGAIPGDGIDDTQAIQNALNSGASTIYFPNSKNVAYTTHANITNEDIGSRYEVSGTLTVGPNVTRLVGMCTGITPTGNLSSSTANLPVFKFVNNGVQRTIVMENFRTAGKHSKSYFVEQASANTLVLRSISVRNGYGYRNTTGFGDVFLEDFHVLPIGPTNPYLTSTQPNFSFTNQRVWARQLNPEQGSVNIVNDGATLWILGLKTEWPTTVIETKNGGKTEVLGGFTLVHVSTATLISDNRVNIPAFINNNSSVSIAGFGEARSTSSNGVFTNMVQETRGTTTTYLTTSQLPKRKAEQDNSLTCVIPLYTGYSRDLQVTGITWGATPTVGQPVTFSATIKNFGNTATPNIKHGVRFSVDGAVVSWSSYYVGPLNPGQSVTVNANGGPNSGSSTWTATAGGHQVTALVDDTYLIPENNETNNTGTATLLVGTTLAPVRDAFVRAGSFANSPNGTAINLFTKHNSAPEYEREAYLTFPLGALPGNITSAKLRVYKGTTGAPAGTIAVGAYSVATLSWTEAGLTWTNKPTPGTTALASVNATAAAGYVEWDVTSYVAEQEGLNKAEVGFALKNIPSAEETLVWNSREATADRPQLVLTFAATPAARGVLASGQATGSDAALTLYPNPAQNAVTVELTSAAAQSVKIRVTSTLGQALDLQTISVPAGLSRHTLNTSHLANGLYLLTVQQGTSTSTQRLLIAR